MWKLLRNTKLASAVGFLILILLIWAVGPYLGLDSRESRFGWIFGVMLIWVMTLLVGRFLADRAGGLLEKVLRRQADDAVIEASPEQRRDVTQLRQRLLGAIDTLKTSKLGRTSGKAALYELPWYMIIGHPAAGKSSAVLNSGLTFPFGDKQAIQGVGGTRNCDWFFSTEGVLLDTAGRYSTQREDRPEWLSFLKLLKKYRSKSPINGILVAVSYPELAQHNSESFSVYARQVRERISEIDEIFGVKVPIYLIFTKIDLVGGFAQFFEDMSQEERLSVWGATLSHDQGSEFDAVRVVGQQFDMLHRGLVQMGFDKLADNRGSVNRTALFAFPIEFGAMREAVCKFVGMLFLDNPYHSKPLLRGFYFSSALQEGNPRIAAGNRISNLFDLSKWGFNAAQPAASNSYFLHQLFSDVVFPDQHLIARRIRPISTRMRMAGIVGGLSVVALLAGLLTWSYVGNQKLIASGNEELLVARQLSKSGELVDRLKALQVLQLRIEQLYRYRKEGRPFGLGVGLYRGDEVEQALRKEYFAGLKALMLDPVKSGLEQTLADLRLPATVQIEPPKPQPAKIPAPRYMPRRGALPVVPIGYEQSAAEWGRYWGGLEFPTSGTPVLIRAQVTASRPTNVREALQRLQQADVVAAGGSTPQVPVVEASRLEDGYNALKTYLMLNHKERLDASHLSDQIPKYWRPWLTSNIGRGGQEEISRLAERIVGFYVSQINEPDLPLIDNRQDLVGTSREVLRGASRRMSATERVYNELKARANTQFAPMTVGRILNNQGLDLVAGSVALPGAFTREAWEKYFSTAIAEASKGEVKGDDWVLASTTLDNLSKGGDVERNRSELEGLYKADYAREWKKFMQGLAVQDFGSLEVAAQSMGKLSDVQHSPLQQILAKAAYETSWDNPSQLSKSIDSAKDSVISRTERLVRGSSGVPAQAGSAAVQYGELGTKFSIFAIVSTPAEGGRTPLSGYLDMLGKLRGRLSQIASSSEPGLPARQLMQATLSGSGSEFVEALAYVDGVLLANTSEESKEVIRPILVRPLVQAYSALIPPVTQDINSAWAHEVLEPWRGLSSKYPFAESGNEASISEISKFLKPGEGTLSRFVEKNLAGLIVKRGDVFVARTWANVGINFGPAFLSGVSRLSSAGSAVLQEGEGAKFELQPVPTPGLSEILIEIDGQVMRYRNGPQPWTSFSWPNTSGGNAQGARIQTVSFEGVSTSVANHNGRLGLMRLLGQAKTAGSPGSTTAQLEWRFKPSRSTNSRGIPGEAESDVVRVNYRAVSGANLLSMSGLRRQGLPDMVTN
jgi:type VI secretion system protein ImpL